MRELAGFGLQAQAEASGIENLDSVFYKRFGPWVSREVRGRHAGHEWPEIGIHRGKRHRRLDNALRAGSGVAHVPTQQRCTGLEPDDSGASPHFTATSSGAPLAGRRVAVVIACVGVNSAIRRPFYPEDKLAFAGIKTWRGGIRHWRICSGKWICLSARSRPARG